MKCGKDSRRGRIRKKEKGRIKTDEGDRRKTCAKKTKIQWDLGKTSAAITRDAEAEEEAEAEAGAEAEAEGGAEAGAEAEMVNRFQNLGCQKTQFFEKNQF